MSGLEYLPGWATVPVALLLVLGASIVLIGALGLLRLPTFYQRIHGPAITITLGAGCLLLASMLYFTVAQSRLVIHEIIIAVFLLMTAPVVSMMIMRAAVYRDLRARKHDAGATAGDVYVIPEEADKGIPGQPD
ncbi:MULTISPECIES: monovalent cation/H(+) antiporter subunit G [Massilia]|uniref:monovalent cation/H(+) antiporter subunit G n=1 Tax=Massilia TaxID=149698 RepID=UPI0004E3CE3A|nr:MULTISPECIES: monovalent cation/H(+) antiporter subunit G [Massilia]KFC75199.1 putative K(+)/H(+) antiporter subunit G phaG-like protein [Massilia sp. LC238]MDK6079162.1 monovalent cation/H(+) antiporter subunit G [Massilia varians]